MSTNTAPVQATYDKDLISAKRRLNGNRRWRMLHQRRIAWRK